MQKLLDTRTEGSDCIKDIFTNLKHVKNYIATQDLYHILVSIHCFV